MQLCVVAHCIFFRALSLGFESRSQTEFLGLVRHASSARLDNAQISWRVGEAGGLGKVANLASPWLRAEKLCLI